MKPKKERDIVKLLYEENKEYSKVMAFVKKHMRDNHQCRGFASRKIQLAHDLPITSFGNALCDYIEHLQNQINDLKNGKGSR